MSTEETKTDTPPSAQEAAETAPEEAQPEAEQQTKEDDAALAIREIQEGAPPPDPDAPTLPETVVDAPTLPETVVYRPAPQSDAEIASLAAEKKAREATDAAATAAAEAAAAAAAAKDTFGEGIDEPTEFDVLNGRGAAVNAHKGNQRFRALCFQRKPEFEAGNHAAKRRVATEIVGVTKALPGRFLRKREKQGPWYELTQEKCILKACQVMRDFQRPDRVALREMARENARKRNKIKPPSTPLPDTPAPAAPLEPIIENPFGVHDHDILCGRGAFVNGHVGNQRFRKLAVERKVQFEAGNYSEKRALATEIVGIMRALDPPGRFLKRKPKDQQEKEQEEGGEKSEWEELSDDKAIHKACQVMRDIDRPDRGPDRRKRKREEAAAAVPEEQAAKDSITMLAETTATASAVQEAVAAAEAALDKVMDGVETVPPAVASEQEEVTEQEKATTTEPAKEKKAGAEQMVEI